MPLRLILTRHAKSSWKDPLESDHNRPLNKRGRASAQAMGDWLRKHGHRPDTTLSSSSRRTEETQELMGLGGEVEFSEKLYHAGAHAMLKTLKSAKGETVMLLGHNPGIGEFAERMAAKLPAHKRFLDYPTCATTVFEFETDNWEDVQFGSGKVKAFVIPRELI